MKPCGAVGPRPVAPEVHEASSWAEITLESLETPTDRKTILTYEKYYFSRILSMNLSLSFYLFGGCWGCLGCLGLLGLLGLLHSMLHNFNILIN